MILAMTLPMQACNQGLWAFYAIVYENKIKFFYNRRSSGGDSGIRTEQSSSAGGVVASHMLGASMSDEYEIGMRANGPGGKGGKKHGKGNHR